MYQAIVFLPLLGSVIAGLFGRLIGSRPSEILTTTLLFAAMVLSWVALALVGFGHEQDRVRVATFIVCWAIAMQEDGSDSYSITEYMRYWNENERKAYRVQKEFRELWGEYETPNALAQQILRNVRSRLAKKDVEKLPMTLRVSA